jgi:hypothetical protein
VLQKLFIIISIVYCGLSAQANYATRYAIGPDTYTPLVFDDVVALLDQLPQKNLESLLAQLRQNEPAMFRDYVLMYRSRSLQGASFMNPRALLVGRNGHLVLSFNGHSSQPGYAQLEAMSYIPEQQRFEFREISFLNDSYQVSEANPQKCLNCHQSSSRKDVDPRPNWEPYNVWPGSYGSVGHISPVTYPHYKDNDRFNPELSQLKDLENLRMGEFLETNHRTHPRYQHLEPMVELRTGQSTRYFTASSGDLIPNSMPTRFTHAIIQTNLERLARLIRQSPIFETYKETLMGAIRCNHFFMPQNVYQWHQDNYLRGSENNFRAPFISNQGLYGGILSPSIPQSISFIFEPHGIDTTDWSTDFGTNGAFASNNRFGGPHNLTQDLREAMQKVWGRNDPLLTQNCQELAEVSFAKMEQLQLESFPTAQAPSADQLIQRCISCHAIDRFFMFNAPHIPFGEPWALAPQLQQEGYPRGTLKDEIIYRVGPHATITERMPADGYIPTPPEIEALKAYLEDAL